MKKIQVSTVQQTAQVEVIYVNAHLIRKAIQAKLTLDAMLDGTKAKVFETDDEGGIVMDENGKEVQKRDENGNLMWSYNYYPMRKDEAVKDLHEIVKAFIDELTDAFE